MQEGVCDQIMALVAAQPEDSVFFKPFNNIPDTLDKDTMAALKQEAAAIIRTQIQPAFAKTKDFIQRVSCNNL